MRKHYPVYIKDRTLKLNIRGDEEMSSCRQKSKSTNKLKGLIIYITLLFLFISGCDLFNEETKPHYILSVFLNEDAGGRVLLEPEKSKYVEGTEVSLTASPNEGWKFKKWSGEVDEKSSPTTLIVMDGDKEVTAYFEEKEEEAPTKYSLTLEVDPEGSGEVSGGGSYEAGSELNIEVQPEEGWEFLYWVDLNETVISEQENFFYTMPGKDMTLIAKLEEEVVFIHLSGIVEDTETKFPVSTAEVRVYGPNPQNDKGDLLGTTFSCNDGFWDLEFEKTNNYDFLVVQSGRDDYFIRSTIIDYENNDNVLKRIVADDLEGFKEFMWETTAGAMARLENEEFEGVWILKDNPEEEPPFGEGEFSEETIQYIKNLIIDPNEKVDQMLGVDNFDVNIGSIEDYIHNSRRVYVVPDETINGGAMRPWGHTRGPHGALISINPFLGSSSGDYFKFVILHEFGHIIYPSHPSNPESIMYVDGEWKTEYTSLDLKGARISYEETYNHQLEYPGGDSLRNVLGEEWGIEDISILRW